MRYGFASANLWRYENSYWTEYCYIWESYFNNRWALITQHLHLIVMRWEISFLMQTFTIMVVKIYLHVAWFQWCFLLLSKHNHLRELQALFIFTIAYPAPSHYLNQCWVIVNWNKHQWNCTQNTTLFIHENASENIVCEMAAILSRETWVKQTHVLC